MQKDAMKKFGFLLGSWNLEYRIPKSIFSAAGTDSGTGSFRKILNDKYILFEYVTATGGEAKGIFAWDDKLQAYRYWWFENSGSFQTATCNFINDEILAMNWHDTLLVQTFVKENKDKVVLKMQYPGEQEGYVLVLEVILKRK
ncbi:MAG: hypothetical protein JW973_15795 [Bacteroidales bacterium]|nr:hypothetical protein [Bacteroidales bacterium]